MSIINSQPRIGAAGQSTGFKIERSLRFNSADSAYLNRTPASAGNRKTWTWSGWIKGGVFASPNAELFSCGLSGTNEFALQFNGSSQLRVYDYTSSYQFELMSTAVYRDPSAWYHVVVAIDTTQATSSNRVKLYVNGVQITALGTATYPTQNYEGFINTAAQHNLGRTSYGYLSGYLTEVHFIDGSTPTTTTRTVGGVTETVLTQFGEFDTDTGVWKPKAYSGSYGTNGFYLKFADNSGTTSTTLGKDSSGNGNNWTPNNFSVTAGAGNDSLVDTPTPYGTDTGAGGEVRGNYATLNPLDHVGGTFSNGNLDVVVALASTSIAVGNFAVSSGKWYWEVTPTAMTDAAAMIGVADSSKAISDRRWTTANGWIYAGFNGQKYNNNSGASYGATFTTNDVIGVALNMDDGSVTFYKNGSSQGVAYNTGLSGNTIQPMLGNGTTNGSQTCVFNFGQRPFAYTAPSGFKALCTQNLPTPTIGATATTRADDYFDTSLYTGTASTLSVTNSGMQPDLVWLKRRDGGGTHHYLIDAVRGTNKLLFSSLTDAEYTDSTYLTSFNSNGFTLGYGDTGTNANGGTYVGWQWKANGAGSSNTSGTITSTVSANTTAGFSVATYTGNGSNSGTIGHGLGVTPSMVIFKNRGSAESWRVYHTSLGVNAYVLLNSTAASASDTGWIGVNSTTLNFGGSGAQYNANTNTYVAYCFAPVAGYSAFGSYTGNGSGSSDSSTFDGPFVYTGFRPAYVLVKVSAGSVDVPNNWQIWDSKRQTYNANNLWLRANTSQAEGSTYFYVDFLSNGFKIRSQNFGELNGNANTYIYAAFAETPFKYSLAR